MVEVVKMNPGDQQTLLTVLPFISDGFTSSAEFKGFCLATMAEICSRKTLSQQYVRAFASLILLNLEKDAGLDEFQASLKTVLVILQFQQLPWVQHSDLLALQKQSIRFFKSLN